MITPGRLLYLFQRDMERGWRASFHDYFTLPKIERYHRPDFPSTPATVPVHLLTGRNDWRLALWMLASFHYFTQRRWPVIVHDDGTLPSTAAAIFRDAFPELQIIARSEADNRMQPLLQNLPRCAQYRRSHPLGLKIFDMPALTAGSRLIILDSDVLFFARPDDLLDWVESGRDDCRFMRDVAEASNVSAEQAAQKLGVSLPECVNSGLCLLPRSAVDPVFCERCFEQTSILDGHIWRVEQTLFALCAGQHGKASLLPGSYEITLARNGSTTSVVRHYVGAVRSRFYAEGLPRLRSLLIGN